MIRRLLTLLALIVLPSLALAMAGAAFGATPAQTARIVVPAHDIQRGDIIGESDLTYAEVPEGAMAATTVTKFESLTGLQARRMLRAGQGVRPDDVRRPVVVSKGQTVTMTFTAPGVELTAMGRAMSEGGIGDTVTIQNPASFRMVSATVTGAGTVRATGPMGGAFTTARK
jgi:flagella basal body P-ring formation protein FlgA